MLTRFGIFLLWLIHFLPLRLQAMLGNGLGRLLYLIGRERRHVASTNLRLCFPDWDETTRQRVVRQNFCAFGRSLIERGLLWWAPAARIQRLIRVEGWEHYTTAQAQGAVILLAPHFVALDVGGSWLIQHVDLVSVYSTQKNPRFNALLLHGRSRFGDQKLYARQQGLRPVIKAMRELRPFYYLPDQDLATKDGVFSPFFGVPAATLTTVPRLADMTGARVVPCISKLLPGGEGYEVRFYPAWENYPTGDVQADTDRMNAFIEARVREMPEQYFWLHKRFKTRPEGEAKFY